MIDQCADNDPIRDCPCGGQRGKLSCMFPSVSELPDFVCLNCGWYLDKNLNCERCGKGEDDVLL